MRDTRCLSPRAKPPHRYRAYSKFVSAAGKDPSRRDGDLRRIKPRCSCSLSHYRRRRGSASSAPHRVCFGDPPALRGLRTMRLAHAFYLAISWDLGQAPMRRGMIWGKRTRMMLSYIVFIDFISDIRRTSLRHRVCHSNELRGCWSPFPSAQGQGSDRLKV